jgi:hypothetical protein
MGLEQVSNFLHDALKELDDKDAGWCPSRTRWVAERGGSGVLCRRLPTGDTGKPVQLPSLLSLDCVSPLLPHMPCFVRPDRLTIVGAFEWARV